MTREEAIKVLSSYDVNGVWADVDGKPYNAEEQAEAFDMAIEALDERKVELFDDGTLVVNVKEGEKVGRVLIEGDDHFGGLYYIDAEPVVRCIDCIFWYDCEYSFKSENGFCCCGERSEESEVEP